MKLKFKIAGLRFAVLKKSNAMISANRQSGVALIITLILMSVTLLMAVAFLLLSQRQQAAAHTQADDAKARLAADAALQNAEAQIVANVMASPQPNPYGGGLFVSTNYINYGGFQSGIANPTNVNYDYLQGGGALKGSDDLQNLGNLLFSPRLPVFVPTNPSGASDFRYYLDLNRNGQFDPNNQLGQTVSTFGDPEWIGVLERPDVNYGPDNPGIARYAFIAIPVGNSLDINAIHNQALIPQSGYPTDPMSHNNDAFFRNQGVGSWELNLAAFLADLNTNEWGRVIGTGSSDYQYRQPMFANSGFAFEDAFSILTNRYAGNYNTLDRADNLFQNAANTFENDNIDGYSDGTLQTGFSPPFDTTSPLNDDPSKSWAGADNTNHFFNLPMELFDPGETSAGFTNRLRSAAFVTTNEYDRTTFYRLLSQLSTDSDPESDKINLNYSNALMQFDTDGIATNITIIPGAETNFTPWTPIQFFTIAADKMLRTYTARWAAIYATNNLGFVTNGVSTNFVRTFNVTNSFGIADIPVWVSNKFVYTPAVQRVLQLAANFYDAAQTNFYPSVFRPLFMHDNDGNVFVVGYEDFNATLSTNRLLHGQQLTDRRLSIPAEVRDLLNYPANTVIETNVYGVPWIVGAKKAFPNFNEFAIQSAFQVTRKLELLRDTNAPTQPDIIATNQMYLMSITNFYGIECWNPYRSIYQGADDIIVRCSSTTHIPTNENNTLYAANGGYYFTTNFVRSFETPYWPAWDGVIKNPGNSFILPLNTSAMMLTNAMYVYNSPGTAVFTPVPTDPENYYDQGIRPMPHMVLLMTNRLQVIIIDYSTNASPGNTGKGSARDSGRVVDYVQLGGMDSDRDLTAEIQANDSTGMWKTNIDPSSGAIWGIYNQINGSKTGYTLNPVTDLKTDVAHWSKTPYSTPDDEIAFFDSFFSAKPPGIYNVGGTNYYNTLTNMQAPYTPTITVYQHTSWQANDPLVHYLATDLAASGTNDINSVWPGNLGKSNDRYLPWAKSLFAVGADPNPCNYAFKDPLVYEAGDWDFPTNKLPTVGWLGRVHRGTPWQTIYLKSTNILAYAKTPVSGITTWIDWTGDQNGFDQTNTAPVEDRLLFDLFTTAFNDNATRGTLSVNVGATASSHNLAAWSALFSGVDVLSNSASRLSTQSRGINWPRPALAVSSSTIQPAGPYTVGVVEPSLYVLASNIDLTRSDFRNRDGVTGVFEHTGDILATPQLSEQSPFINKTGGIQLTNANDEIFEWLPQQTMSLLRVGSPRYVIYSWGQTLKPAPNSVYSGGGPFFGMITNYQVMAEAATRAVVRIEGAPTNTHAVVESFNVLPPQ